MTPQTAANVVVNCAPDTVRPTRGQSTEAPPDKWRTCMRTRLAAVIVFLTFSATSHAQSVEVGDYLVVRGAIAGCEGWENRILDVKKVQDDRPLEVLGLRAMDVLGLDSREIHIQLLRSISAATGRTPKSLRVEILNDDSEYRLIIGEYRASLYALIKDKCALEHRRLDPLEPIEENLPLEIAEKLVRAPGARDRRAAPISAETFRQPAEILLSMQPTGCWETCSAPFRARRPPASAG